MTLLRAAITYLSFPVTFVASLVAGWYAFRAGGSAGMILFLVTLASLVLVAIFERVHPEHVEWNRSRGDVGTDLVHALVSMVSLPPILEAALAAVLLGVAADLATLSPFTLWPHTWPIVGQLLLAMIVSQFFEYWVHRLCHTVPLLWRLHATHHSPHRLYWLNAARFHPLDTTLSVSVSFASFMVLGVGEEVFLLASIWVAVHGMFQHCNVRLRLGPLNWIFSMAELHRWHHSPVLEEANNNYGNNLLFWDIVFGTVYYPKDREARVGVGLSDMPDFPQDYVGQLLSPWRWKKLLGGPDTPSQEEGSG